MVNGSVESRGIRCLFSVIVRVRVVFRKGCCWWLTFPWHKYHHLTTTRHLTLTTAIDSWLLSTAQVVETSVTNNSLSKDYLHQDNHANQTTKTFCNSTEMPKSSEWDCGNRHLKIPRFRCTGKLSVLVSTSRLLFTPEKRPGYRVAGWLVITKYEKTWKNIEKHGVLPVRRNRSILRSLMVRTCEGAFFVAHLLCSPLRPCW